MVQVFSMAVSKRVALLAVVDYAIIVSALIGAVYLTAPLAPDIFLLYEGGLNEILITSLLFILALFFANLYTEVRILSRVALAVGLAQVFGFLFLAHAALVYVGLLTALEPQLLLIGSALTAPPLFAWRIVFGSVLWTALPTERILLIGYPPEINMVLADIQQRPALGISVVGYLGSIHSETAPMVKHLGEFAAFEAIVAAVKPTRIIVDAANLRIPGLQPCLFSAHLRRIPVERFGTFYEQVTRRVCTSELRPSSVVFERELDAKPRAVALQSIYTNLIALVGAALLFPFMMVIGLWIRATLGLPALESRPRLGLNGVAFRLYQFRCHAKDGSVTAFGAWLQKHGLNKLPQFLNVLRGEMSMIGPAAVRPEFAQALRRYIPYEPQRRTVRPGMLEWSSLFYPGDRVVDELVRVEYDLYYIKHISLSLDLYIILAVLKQALSRAVSSGPVAEQAA